MTSRAKSRVLHRKHWSLRVPLCLAEGAEPNVGGAAETVEGASSVSDLRERQPVRASWPTRDV